MSGDDKAPRAPVGLGPGGRRLWREVMAGWDELRPDERLLLERCCRTVDTIEEMDRVLDGAGFLSTGSTGQTVAHPLVAERRQHLVVLSRMLRQLGLPEQPGERGGARRMRTVGARKAARARWGTG